MSARALVLAVLLLVGCQPSDRATSFRGAGKSPPVVTVINTGHGEIHVRYDASLTVREINEAASAIQDHWLAAQNLAHPVSIYLGKVWPPRGNYRVWVHNLRTLGGPYSPAPVLGEIRYDDAHLVIGEACEVPDFIRQTVHMWYAPGPDESWPAGFWPRVHDVQNQSVKMIRLSRGYVP